MLELIGFLVLLVLGGWFFIASLRVRENAIKLSRQACQREGLQFLDDTVSASHIGLRRDGRGQLRVNRTYQFEFSDNGVQRHTGYIVMLGDHLQILHLNWPGRELGASGHLH
ncbi:MAG: DUF3301 domain-containing protein [Gammaproteobacteria bacterium]|nr:DUF3301 domain-containing protein [Gammaproteobacteria bacterium]